MTRLSARDLRFIAAVWLRWATTYLPKRKNT